MYLLKKCRAGKFAGPTRIVLLALWLASLATGRAGAQTPAPPPGSTTRAVQLPLSGAQPAGVVIQHTAVPPPGSSVNTVNTQIQVQGAYNGSVPGAEAAAGKITLTLSDAVRRGLATNLGVINADANTRLAEAQRVQVRSALLPNVNANLSENAAKVNLAAEGFSANTFGSLFPSQFPTTVGPFHYYDVQGSVQQSLLDLTAIHNLRSADHASTAATLDARQSREEVVLGVTGVYLQIMATSALVEEQQAEVKYAEASYKQARAQVDVGNKAPIEANRSQVELQTEQQRLRAQTADLQKQKYALARLIGLPLNLEIELEEKLAPLPAENPSLEQTVLQAWAQRQDLKAAEAQLRAAEEARKAAGAEHAPSASLNGAYGLEGTNPNTGSGVFQAAVSLNIPIFQGGRIGGDVAQADAVVTERRAELANRRGAIELDVRNAYVDLGVADEQVVTAESNRKLALTTLRQSQDRFAVGVTDSLEVVNSQQALAAADHDYVSSLFSQYLARLSLAHAMGEAEKDLPNLFTGIRP
jgi:outer membrane protein TolC